MAVRLGILDVKRIFRELTAKEFFEWQAYAELEPFDEVRADLRAALIAQIIANTMGRAEGQDAYTLDDFTLKFEPKEEDPEKAARDRRELHVLWIKSMALAHSAKNVEEV